MGPMGVVWGSHGRDFRRTARHILLSLVPLGAPAGAWGSVSSVLTTGCVLICRIDMRRPVEHRPGAIRLREAPVPGGPVGILIIVQCGYPDGPSRAFIQIEIIDDDGFLRCPLGEVRGGGENARDDNLV